MIKIKFIDNKEYTKRNAKPVTNSNLKEVGVEAPDGLLDPNIFGHDMEHRGINIGFIQLGGNFFHPVVYERLLKRSFRGIDGILRGTDRYSIDSKGEFVPDEKGGTGIKWLMTNFSKTKFARNFKDEDSITTKELKTFLKNREVKDIVMNKYTVIPISGRDIEITDESISLDEVNTLYRSLIGLVDTYDNNKEIRVYDTYVLEFRIQTAIVGIFNHFEGKIFKKYGEQRKGIMSRNVDYGSRLVWSAPDHTENGLGNDWIDIDTCGHPLSATLDTCILLVLHYSKSVVDFIADSGGFDVDGKRPTNDDLDEFYGESAIIDFVDIYSHSRLERCKYLPKPGKPSENATFTYKDDKGEDVTKPLTMMEFLYMCAYIAVEDRDLHLLITRYPVQGPMSMKGKRVHITTIKDLKKINFNGLQMDWFPDTTKLEGFYGLIHDKNKSNDEKMSAASAVDNAYNETLQLHNSIIDSMGGDYDGDKSSGRIMFTDEANQELRDANDSPASLFDVDGSCRMFLGLEGVQGAFDMTRDPAGKKEKDKVKLVDKAVVDKILSGDFDMDYLLDLMADNIKKPSPYKQYYPVKLTAYKHGFRDDAKSITTTLGRLIFNVYAISESKAKFINIPLTSKSWGGVLKEEGDRVLATGDKEDLRGFKRMLTKYEELCFKFGAVFASTTDLESYALSITEEKERARILAKYQDKIDEGSMDAMEHFETETLDYLSKSREGDQFMNVMHAGVKVKMNNQAKAAFVSIGTMPVDMGEYSTTTSNYIHGYKKEELVNFSKSGLLGGYYRSVAPAIGGAKAKLISSGQQTGYVSKYGTDCKTKDLQPLIITKNNYEDIVGKTILFKGKMVKVSYDNVKQHIGTTIQMRSMTMCENVDFCSVCTGDKVYDILGKDKRIPFGLYVTALGDQLVQKSLKKVHINKAVFNRIDPNDFIMTRAEAQAKSKSTGGGSASVALVSTVDTWGDVFNSVSDDRANIMESCEDLLDGLAYNTMIRETGDTDIKFKDLYNGENTEYLDLKKDFKKIIGKSRDVFDEILADNEDITKWYKADTLVYCDKVLLDILEDDNTNLGSLIKDSPFKFERQYGKEFYTVSIPIAGIEYDKITNVKSNGSFKDLKDRELAEMMSKLEHILYVLQDEGEKFCANCNIGVEFDDSTMWIMLEYPKPIIIGMVRDDAISESSAYGDEVKKGQYNEGDLVPEHDAIGTVIHKGNSILILDHNKIGLKTIPVGKVDYGDTVEGTVKKEMKEELGITVSELIPYEDEPEKQVFMRDGHKIVVTMHIYEITNYSGKPVNKEPNKHKSVEWVDIDYIISHPKEFTDTTVRVCTETKHGRSIGEAAKTKPDPNKVKMNKAIAKVNKVKADYVLSLLHEARDIKALNKSRLNSKFMDLRTGVEEKLIDIKSKERTKMMSALSALFEKMDGKSKIEVGKLREKIFSILPKENEKVDIITAKKIEKYKAKVDKMIDKVKSKFV